MNVDDLQRVFHERADEASRVVLDVDAMVRRGGAARRRRMAGAVLVVVVAAAAAITIPLTLARGSGSPATVAPVASPSDNPHTRPSPQVTQFPCAGPFLVECGSYPIPTEFVKPVTTAIVDYAGLLGATPQFVVADPATVARHFGLNVAAMPSHVYLMQLKGQFTCLTCQGPAGSQRAKFSYLVAAIPQTPSGPGDTPFFYSASNHATDLHQFGRPF